MIVETESRPAVNAAQGRAGTCAQWLLRLDGEWDEARLRRSLEEAASRHRILQADSQPDSQLDWQFDRGASPVAWHSLDGSNLGELELGEEELGDQELEAYRRSEQEAFSQADPGDISPLRALFLAPSAQGERYLLLTVSTEVCDGAALEQLIAETLAAYDAPGSPPVEASRVSYEQVVRWRAGLAEDPASAEDRELGAAFWRRQQDSPAGLPLPFRREDDPAQPWTSGQLAVPGPSEAELSAAAERCGVGTEAFVLALWQVFLARIAVTREEGTPDAVPVAVELAGRDVEALAAVMGPLARRVPLTAWPDASAPFQTAARGAHRQLEEALDWVDFYAGETTPPDVFEAADAPRWPRPAAGTVTPVLRQVALRPYRLKLTLSCGRLTLGFDLQRIGEPAAACWAEQLGTLARAAVKDPQLPLAALPLLGEEERRRLLGPPGRAGEAALALPAGSVLELIAHQVRWQPQAPALASGDRELSYGQLWSRVSSLAETLAERLDSAAAERVVAVDLEDPLEMAVAFLGILAAGAAYVPLDRRQPAERSRQQVVEAGAKTVLTEDPEAWQSSGLGLEVLTLGGEARKEWEVLDEGSAAPELVIPGAAALAYVLFTSGSTGRPKAVAVEHGQLRRYVESVLERLAPPPASRFAVVSTLAADLGLTAFYPALASGGCVELLPLEAVTDGELLAEHFARRPPAVLKIVPAHLEALLGARGARQLLPTEVLVLGGDRLSLELRRRLRQLAPGLRVVNHYGPTETTVGVATHEAAEAPAEASSVPIGRPLAAARLYVVDLRGELLPRGPAGHILIGGGTVARGYLGRPGLTAERFRPDPFADRRGARLYRSGDLGRWLPGGELEFLGRIDEQVKIRGFRVEPGEVQARLRALAEIRDAVVVARRDDGRGPVLTAYYVPAAGAPEPLALEDELRRWLPEAMIPTRWVALAELPLTANGKIDRAALPRPESPRGTSGSAPATRQERILAEVWKEVLGLDEISATDSFFRLGGDSILAIQVVSRARLRGLEVQPRQIFQHQTLADLARVATAATAVTEDTGPVSGPVPWTPVQRWFLEQGGGLESHFNQALLLQLGRRVKDEDLHRAWQRLMEHHDALRLRVHREDGVWRQEIGTVAEAAERWRFHTVGLGHLAAERLGATMEELASGFQRSLDPIAGPALRVVLFDAGEDEPQQLLMVLHHLLVDGVSWRILLEDLEHILAAEGGAVELPPRTTSFQRWAQSLEAAVTDEEVRRQLEYWQSQSARRVDLLPLDFEGGDNRVAGTAVLAEELDPQRTEALLRQVPRAFRTEALDLLLAALGRCLAAWTGREEICVELESHGREPLGEAAEAALDLSRTVGWFTNHYPLRLRLSGSLEDDLIAAKEGLRGVPHRGVGYGVLRYLASGAPGLAEAPSPPVRLNYLGQVDQALSGSTSSGTSGSSASGSGNSLFAPSMEQAGPQRGGQWRRCNAFEVTALVEGERLRLIWTYSREQFREPTVRQLAAALRRQVEELVDHCLQAEVGRLTPSDVPLAGLDDRRLAALLEESEGEVEDIYPLGPMQEGILFHALVDPSRNLYCQQMAGTLRGDLDLESFRGAWDAVIDHHPALRTAFAWERLERPLQVVYRRAPLPMPVEDWSELEPAAQQQRFEDVLRRDRARGFELGQAPLIRVSLFRLSAGTHRFLWTYHHLPVDGWSLSRVIRQVFAVYEARLAGEALTLPSSRPYRDYVAWLEARDGELTEAFWRRYLEGFEAPLSLDFGWQREAAPGDEARNEFLAVDLPAELSAGLHDLGRRRSWTFSTLMQGAWALLLSRYGGETDVVFGLTVSGRPAQLIGVEEMIGLFINTVPCRVQLEDSPTLGGYLGALQDAQGELLDHAYSSLAELQRWSPLAAGTPLFENILVIENYPVERAAEGRGAALSLEDVDFLEQTNFPLVVSVWDGERVRISIDFDQRLFHRSAIQRLAGHLEVLLTAFLGAPETPLRHLELLTAAERRQLLVDWNATETPFPRHRLVHELFEECAARHPQRPAVVCEDESRTYGELNGDANRLARRLVAAGVEAETVTALLMQRGPALITSMLAVFKAGGAYVPLDPEHPPQRLQQVLERSGARWLLTDGEHRNLVPELSGLQRLVVDEELNADESGAEENLPRRCQPHHLAYVIYTSGSTGAPKGAMNIHLGFLNHVLLKARDLELTEDDVVAQVAAQTFDISIWQYLSALVTGGRVVVHRDDIARDAQRQLQHLDSDGVTIFQTVPSMQRALVEEAERLGGERPPLSALRWIIPNGETLPPELCHRWFALYPHVPIINAYGFTECSDELSHQHIRQPPPGRRVPVGKPLHNHRAFLLDPAFNPVPVGVGGQLFMGGLGVGRGYQRDPRRTAASFVPDPFAHEPGSRMYRSGDLVRLLEDGSLDFLNRLDFQVKIRGFRIELGEIENVLRSWGPVRDAVVLARKDAAGASYLCAFLVAEEGLETAAVRGYLEDRLPRYMVPARYLVLDRLPLNRNGKVDRKALPEIPAEAVHGEAYEAPRTELEATLCRVWSEVLEVERVGIHDDFYELGGHSLSATRLVARIGEELAIKLPLRTLFLQPTVAELAQAVEAARRTETQEEGSVQDRMEELKRRIAELKAQQGEESSGTVAGDEPASGEGAS